MSNQEPFFPSGTVLVHVGAGVDLGLVVGDRFHAVCDVKGLDELECSWGIETG